VVLWSLGGRHHVLTLCCGSCDEVWYCTVGEPWFKQRNLERRLGKKYLSSLEWRQVVWSVGSQTQEIICSPPPPLLILLSLCRCISLLHASLSLSLRPILRVSGTLSIWSDIVFFRFTDSRHTTATTLNPSIRTSTSYNIQYVMRDD
jgi:hypothetical protein